jgi:DNA polymerase
VLKKAELKPIVTAWRTGSPNIVKLWSTVQDAAIGAIETGQVHGVGHGVSYYTKHNTLFAQLPSGRCLAYPRPEVRYKKMCSIEFNRPFGDFEKGEKTFMDYSKAVKYTQAGVAVLSGSVVERPYLVYEGIGDKHQWCTIHTYGGSLVENLVQAIARDCLAHAMLALSSEGYAIALHVHDEVVCEVPEGVSSLAEVCGIMGQPAPWAKGLPLGADGFEGFYYKK